MAFVSISQSSEAVKENRGTFYTYELYASADLKNLINKSNEK